MAKADFLREKAAAFFEDAQYDIKTKKWFLAAFHLEQTCQLYLKYYLFLQVADFPQTHSIRKLLRYLGKAYQKAGEMTRIIEKNEKTIFDLEQAYITSRYLPVEFDSREIGKMEGFTRKLLSFLKKLR